MSCAIAAPSLSAEQHAAVLHATAGADLAQIVSRAGAGKTTAAAAAADPLPPPAASC
jgi:hypothetical protein